MLAVHGMIQVTINATQSVRTYTDADADRSCRANGSRAARAASSRCSSCLGRPTTTASPGLPPLLVLSTSAHLGGTQQLCQRLQPLLSSAQQHGLAVLLALIYGLLYRCCYLSSLARIDWDLHVQGGRG